jgi:hypothetical protein
MDDGLNLWRGLAAAFTIELAAGLLMITASDTVRAVLSFALGM